MAGKEKKSSGKAGLREYRMLILKHYLSKKSVIINILMILLVLFVGLIAPYLTGHDPYTMVVSDRLQPPSAGHIFGTDTMGRDLFTRVCYGTRNSLVIGFTVAIISTVIGMVLGLIAGYFSFLDNIIIRLCEGIGSIPAVLMAIALIAVFGISTKNVIISMIIIYAPLIVMVTRSTTLSIREMTYIEAIKSQGASWPRIVFRHIAPNVVSPIIVQATFAFASAILTEAGLSFLGAGIPAPAPSLGNILYEGKDVIFNGWWMIVFPGLFMVLTVLSLNMLGDVIRDLLDPLSN